MKKRTKTLIIAAAAILVLAAVMVALLLTQKKPETKEDDTSASQSETVALIEENVDNFKSLEVTNDGGTYLMTSEGEGEDKTYGIEELEGYKAQESNYTYAAQTLSALNATNKVLDSIEDKAMYGLEEPSSVAKVTFAGKEYVLHLGDLIPQKTGYYLMVEGDNALYTVNTQAGELLKQNKFYYLDTELTKSYTSSEEQPPTIKRVELVRKDMEDPIIVERIADAEEAAENYLSDKRMVSPVICNLDFDVNATYLTSLFGLSAHKVVDFYREEDAAKYGFDDPEYVLEMEYQGGRTKIVVGDKTPVEDTDAENAEYRYAICDDDGLVYRFDVTKIFLAKEDPNELISKIPLLPILDTVEQVDLTLDGKTYQFDIVTETVDNEQIYTITKDGETIDTPNFQLFYQLMMTPSIEKINTDPVVDPQSEMKVVYHYNNGKKDDVITAREVANRRLRVSVNGSDYFEGRAAYLDKLANELQNLLSGETVTVAW